MIKVGDRFEINVPLEIRWETRIFRVEELYPHFALLSDGIIKVCYKYWELEHFEQPFTGCWN